MCKMLLCSLCVACVACGATATEKLSVDDLAGKRIMVLGDSITQDGTYVSFIEYYLMQRYPAKNFDIVSIGLASETTSGLSEPGHPFPRPCVHERLGRALDIVKPQVVIACYGMNDGIYHPSSPERAKAFHDGVTKLVKDAQAKGASRVLLLTPPVFDPAGFGDNLMHDGEPWQYFRPYFRYDQVLEEFSRWIMQLRMDGVTITDLHTPMAAILAARRTTNPEFRFAGDGVHPSPLGHLVMAHAFLNAVGVAVSPTDLDAELAKVEADPLFKLVSRHRSLRSENWLPYVGYTRGDTFKKDAIEAAEKAAARLQEEIDRARRVVGKGE